MLSLPLDKKAGIISTVSNAISHPIGQATMAAAPIAAAAIPLVAQHNAEKKEEAARKVAFSDLILPALDIGNIAMSAHELANPQKQISDKDMNKAIRSGVDKETKEKWRKDKQKVAIAPLLAAGASMVGRALAKPAVQTALNLAPVAMSMSASRAPTPSPSPARPPAQSNNIAQPSTAFTPPASQAPTQPKLSSVATTPEGVIDNRQFVQPSLPTVSSAGNATLGGKSQDGSSPGVASTSTPKQSKPKMTTSPGAPKAFKMAWYLPFQGLTHTVKDFGLGAVDAMDNEAAKLLTPSDQLDPVKNRTPPLSNII